MTKRLAKLWRDMTPAERVEALAVRAKGRKRARELGTWKAPTRKQWRAWRAP